MKKTLKNTLIIALITFIYIKCDNASNKNNTDITNGTGTSGVLSTPNLLYPLNSAAEIKLDITLIWNKVSISSNVSVKYTVYLSTVNPPADKVSTSQSDTLFKPKLTLNTTYYWKVVAEDGNGNVKESEVRSFSTIKNDSNTGTTVVLTAPKLITPLNSTTNIKLDTTFIWNKVIISSNTSVKYSVFLSTINPPVDKISTSQPDTIFKPTLALNTTYYWKVSAEDGNGGVKESEVWSFKTIASIPPLVPVLISPRKNSNNISLTDKLTWSTSTGSSGETIKYNVYFGTINSLTKVSSSQVETSYTPRLMVNTTYYWKIEADNGNGGLSVSEVNSFRTSSSTNLEFLSNGIRFISVEGGTFTMGCTSEQGTDCEDDEKPSHSVTLSSFSISVYEVTQTRWMNIMGSNPSYNPNCTDCPVENVSWDNVQTFITTLNSLTGKNYRLPTEAEWEYAARGGNLSKGFKFSGSNDIRSVSWFYSSSGNIIKSVGTKSPNELGIYDMSGNVSEWCSDWLSDYTSTSQINPTGPSTGYYKMTRGGSCTDQEKYNRVSYRLGATTKYKNGAVGFRLVLP